MKQRYVLTALLLLGSILAHAAPAQEAPPAPREQLRQILERPLYQRWKRRQGRAEAYEQHERNAFLKSVDDKLVEWGRAMNKFIRKHFSSGGDEETSFDPGAGSSVSLIGPLFKCIAWGLLIAFVIFGGVLLYRRLRDTPLSGRTGRVLNREKIHEALESGEALALDGPQWLNEANRLAREQNYRAVYRALYLALLSGLHAVNKIDFRKSRTNWNYVSRFRGPTEQRDVFASLTELFDLVWYGLKPAKADAIDDAKHKVASLLGENAAR